MRNGYKLQGWRLSLTRIMVATEVDEAVGLVAGDRDEDAVLMIEGPAETIAAALALVGQLTGAESVAVNVPGTMTYSFGEQGPELPPPAAFRNAALSDAEQAAGASERAKRTRRTKAQIEADKLAEAARVLAASAPAPANDWPLPGEQAPPDEMPTQQAGVAPMGAPSGPPAPGQPMPAGWSPFGSPGAPVQPTH
jgi:hypothetical protein